MTDPARIAVEQPLLDIQDLEVSFRSNSGAVPAVRGVSLTVYPGQTVAIVGESGSGKSTTAHSIINLLPGTGTVTAGRILFEGRDLAQAKEKDFVDIRGSQIGLVPQDPMSNLNPVWKIGFQIEEALPTASPRVRRRVFGQPSCSKKRASAIRRSGSISTRTSSRAVCVSARSSRSGFRHVRNY